MEYYLFIYFSSFHNYSQEEYSPEDPANPCVNYPTEEYESYADCDDKFIRKFLPPGFKPFWTVDNISEATVASFDTELHDELYPHLGIFLLSTYVNF